MQKQPRGLCCDKTTDNPAAKKGLDLASGKRHVSLYEPTGDEWSDYATLSYCWGASGVPFITTAANIKAYRRSIPTSALPSTLRDTIHFLRGLKIRYLWIDALCIIQGGDGGKDWAEQATWMTDIYQGGLLNISALDGGNSDYGLAAETFREVGLLVGTFTSGKSPLYLFGRARPSALTCPKQLNDRY